MPSAQSLSHPRSHRGPAMLATRLFALATLSFAALPAIGQPANDSCSNAITLEPGTVTGTTVGSTRDGTAACGLAENSPDVWYRYTAAASGTARLTTCSPITDFDSVLSVHTGCPGTLANVIACVDDDCSIRVEPAAVNFNVTAGNTYWIRLAGFQNQVGAYELTLTAPPGGGGGDPPANDSCENAIPITDGTRAFSNIDATTDGPSPCGSKGSDIWFTYTATQTGNIQVDTCTGTAYDSVIAVYAGTCELPTLLVCNDDSCSTQSVVQFAATQGQTYLISVGGFSGEQGAGTLRIGTGPEPALGADVTMRVCDAVQNWGAIGGVRGYSISSYTCNLGDVDLNWLGGTNQHPILGMHFYRLHGGAIEQIGISWCKNATNAGAGSGCSPNCNGHGGTVLGAGCQDVYGAFGNGMQDHLGPRSDVNAFTGHFNFPFPIGQPSGDAIYKRSQVRESDLNAANYPGALYYVEGVWVAPDDAASGNGLNNASHRQVNVTPGTYDLTPVSTMVSELAAIYAWRDHGGPGGTVDSQVQIVTADVPGEGRFIIGSRVHDNGNGTWRYEYAVFNLNSHRSGARFIVPRPSTSTLTAIGFHAPLYHSGDPYDNTPWTAAPTSTTMEWASPQTFAQNPNSNALRWGTLYNFRFTTDVAPAAGEVSLGLFRPGDSPNDPAAIRVSGIPTPGGGTLCVADFNDDGGVDSSDFFAFLEAFFASTQAADVDGSGGVDSSDFFTFLAVFFEGC